MKSGLEIRSIKCCVSKEVRERVRALLSENALGRQLGQSCHECKRERVAVRVKIDLTCSSLLDEGISLVSENSLFHE